MVEIRRAEKDDVRLLASLGASTFVQTFGHLYSKENLSFFLQKNHSIEAYQRALADPLTAAWLVETGGGESIGFAVATSCGLPVPDMPERAGELSRLYLLKEHQGGGVGKRLLLTALGWLEENFDHVYLSVYAQNVGAQRLYRRHGFVKVHDYHYMVGDHADPEWIMKREAA